MITLLAAALCSAGVAGDLDVAVGSTNSVAITTLLPMTKRLAAASAWSNGAKRQA
ncbi:hypothetical protein [Bradyrhizobium sp. CER78]|uniref:hypothetical protein n=1 Tax=Bradyrhizobium sp. CER78 TaxID=3039162 RepID=UPI00244BBD1B|nr:hypothetical protein [Bradyrhizobium sp. CER78]MDH2380641.1 hypothetical protein [Bradyrhizobium sp. CER78]